MRPHRRILMPLLLLTVIPIGPARAAISIVRSEFIFTRAPFASCHASTIAQTDFGLVAAWFGGTREGADDVRIWSARRGRDGWSAPVEIARGTGPNGRALPCWNPVLFQIPRGNLLLFYKVGPAPDAWWGMMRESSDSGATWSPPRRLPDGILGPIKDKPVLLQNGTLLCPSSTENDGWRIHVEFTPDFGRSWTRGPSLNDPARCDLIQPTILDHGRGNLQLLCRSRQRRIWQTRSTDFGRTWTRPEPTDLPNPNSGIDAVVLRDGRSLLVYNDTPRGRSPLNLAVSTDGVAWKPVAALETEPGEFSYPAIIQSSDGRVHITYTWKRKRIRHVTVDPGSLP